MTPQLTSPLIEEHRMSDLLGIQLFIQRDDLLPFPLAGNKFRKLQYELSDMSHPHTVCITNGAIDSNHCRTLALLGAERGLPIHLVLHGVATKHSPALTLLARTGAQYDLVDPSDIRTTIETRVAHYRAHGYSVRVIAGGCHTPRGARAYHDAAQDVFARELPDFVYVASGTGATQGGILAAARVAPIPPTVIGVSVARSSSTGAHSVREAADWAGPARVNSDVVFLDQYRDGGYSKWSRPTAAAVEYGWQHGVPLDTTYTGKAFAALLEHVRSGRIAQDSRVLFWHTGGLWNEILSTYQSLQ